MNDASGSTSGFRNTVTIEDPNTNNDMKVNADGSINIGRTELGATLFNGTITTPQDLDIDLVGIDRLAIQLLSTETVPVFLLNVWLEASNDGIHFVTIPVSVTTLTGTDDGLWNVVIPFYNFLRIHAEVATGGGSLKVISFVKAFQ